MVREYLICHTVALISGYILDLIIGDPHGIPHPITAIGRLISGCEKVMLKDCDGEQDRKKELISGILMCIIVIAATVMLTTGLLITAYILNTYLGIFIEAVITCYILAARSLCNESMKVGKALEADDIVRARKELSMIVGRDTDKLDKGGVIRAAVETVAENTSDGVIAPLLYTAVGGPILGMLYKAINTMDSMVGYHNEHYEFFGKAAARLDDMVNYIPSRMSALFIVAASFELSFFSPYYDGAEACHIWKRDRRNHKSPNSAQTESACAGALKLKLGGDSYYKGILVQKPYIGDNHKNIENKDILRANVLMFAAEANALIILVYIMYKLISVIH